MDCTRRSRAENALEKQNLRKSDLKEDETHARRGEAESWEPRNCYWAFALGISQPASKRVSESLERGGQQIKLGDFWTTLGE
jgi:hypothetical protein